MDAMSLLIEHADSAETHMHKALDLDVRIVSSGPVAAALLSSTDDGCDTVRGSDC